MSIYERWDRLLCGLRQEDRYRQLSPPAGVDLSSNDYLGYGGGRRAALARDADRETARSGLASRLLRGQHPVWEQVEGELAVWLESEATLMMSSGYVANEGLLSTVMEPGDWVLSDELNHASLIDGMRLARVNKFIFRHNDLNHLEKGLRTAAQKRAPGQELFVVSESLFGMEGDLCPVDEMSVLADRLEAHFILDEAHATGCFGPSGQGRLLAVRRGRALASVHTGGKALGVAGACIRCGKALKELLVNRCRHFIFTTALPPALGFWWLDALARVKEDDAGRKALHDNAAFFREELARHDVYGLGQHYLVPVVLGSDRQAVAAARQLRAAGWDIRAIRPPSVPEGTARLRISIHADHERATLRAAASSVAEAVRFAAAEAP